MSTITDRATVILLRFIEALDGRPFKHVDPNQIFAAMKQELPDLKPEELYGAADAAKEISRQFRKFAWRTGVKPGKRDVAVDEVVILPH